MQRFEVRWNEDNERFQTVLVAKDNVVANSKARLEAELLAMLLNIALDDAVLEIGRVAAYLADNIE